MNSRSMEGLGLVFDLKKRGFFFNVCTKFYKLNFYLFYETFFVEQLWSLLDFQVLGAAIRWNRKKCRYPRPSVRSNLYIFSVTGIFETQTKSETSKMFLFYMKNSRERESEQEKKQNYLNEENDSLVHLQWSARL